MKQTIKLATCIISMMLCHNNFSFAQFTQVTGSANKYFKTLNAVSGIGIGNAFTLGNPPQAALHINSNQLTFPAAFTPGEVFRTDAPAGPKSSPITSTWRMFRGGSETGLIFGKGGTNNFAIQSSVTTGHLTFHTGTKDIQGIANERMRIRSDGFIAIGNSDAYTAASLLHLNRTGSVPVHAQFTNDNIGTLSGDGFSIGIDGVGNADLIQKENNPIRFFTNTIAERMRITPDGFVGIGTMTPARMLSILGGSTFTSGISLKDGGNGGILELFSAPSGETHIRFDASGTIDGQGGNFQIHSSGRPLFFNVGGGGFPVLFNINNTEAMRINSNLNVGINTVNPSNKLEINSGTSGLSGVSFTQLTSLAQPATNPAAGVLSVNASGEVILVTGAAAGTTFCSGHPDDFMSKKNGAQLCQSQIFEHPSTKFIGIGTTSPLSLFHSRTTPIASPLIVLISSSSTAGLFEAGNEGTSVNQGSVFLLPEQPAIMQERNFMLPNPTPILPKSIMECMGL